MINKDENIRIESVTHKVFIGELDNPESDTAGDFREKVNKYLDDIYEDDSKILDIKYLCTVCGQWIIYNAFIHTYY